jgi:hypothetical protein
MGCGADWQHVGAGWQHAGAGWQQLPAGIAYELAPWPQ